MNRPRVVLRRWAWSDLSWALPAIGIVVAMPAPASRTVVESSATMVEALLEVAPQPGRRHRPVGEQIAVEVEHAHSAARALMECLDFHRPDQVGGALEWDALAAEYLLARPTFRKKRSSCDK